MLVICKCNYCGGPLEIDDSDYGKSGTCPHCAHTTALNPARPPSQQPPVSVSMPKFGRRVKKSQMFGWWSILEIPGYLLFVPCFFMFIAGVFSSKPGSGGAAALVAIPMIIGAGLLSAVGKLRTSYLCSECGNKVLKTSKLCPACKVELV